MPVGLCKRFSSICHTQEQIRTCGPQKPLRVEICTTPVADSGLFLRLFQRTLFGVLALCEADLPCCHFEAFGSVTSARALLSSGNCCGTWTRSSKAPLGNYIL